MIPTDRESKTDLDYALLVTTILPADEAKEADGNEKYHIIVNEALNMSLPRLSDVSANATTPSPFS